MADVSGVGSTWSLLSWGSTGTGPTLSRAHCICIAPSVVKRIGTLEPAPPSAATVRGKSSMGISSTASEDLSTSLLAYGPTRREECSVNYRTSHHVFVEGE